MTSLNSTYEGLPKPHAPGNFRARKSPASAYTLAGLLSTFYLCSIHVLASAHEPVRQLIDTRLNLLSRSLRDRRAATNLT